MQVELNRETLIDAFTDFFFCEESPAYAYKLLREITLRAFGVQALIRFQGVVDATDDKYYVKSDVFKSPEDFVKYVFGDLLKSEPDPSNRPDGDGRSDDDGITGPYSGATGYKD